MLEFVPAASPDDSSLRRAIAQLQSVVATIGNNPEMDADLLRGLTLIVDEAERVISSVRRDPAQSELGAEPA